jgi:hypothetical protein
LQAKQQEIKKPQSIYSGQVSGKCLEYKFQNEMIKRGDVSKRRLP